VQIPSTSLIYLYIPIDPPPGIPDPSVYPAEAALITDDGTEPLDGDYHEAEWISLPLPSGEPGPPEVALLVGGAVTFTTGDYMAFARITAGAERPVLKSGRVRIGVAGN
jgi:hypothetical protein